MRFCLVLLAFAGVAASASAASAQSVELGGEAVNLAMRLSAAPSADQAPSPEVSSQADLTGQMSGLETKLQLGVKTGEPSPGAAGADPGWWNSTSVDLNAAWTPIGAAKFEFAAQNATRVQFTASDPVFSDASQHYAESRQSGLTAGATLTPALGPLPPVDLKLGAQVSSNVQQDAWIGATGAQTGDLTQSETRQLSATLGVSPLSAIKLEAGGQVQAMGLVWSGGRAATYASLDPSARLSATPWAGGSLKLSLDRAVSPRSVDQFIGYGPGAGALESVPPNREWRYGAAVTQKAGPIDLTASVTAAKVQSVAYLAPTSPQTAARVGLESGDRSEASAGLGTPLSVPGLAPFVLQAKATWRASAVQDPLTGVLGRMSGERPYDASLSLSQAIGPGMRWGVTAQAAGPQTNLEPTETARLSPTAGLGGFLQYNALPVSVRLSLDNVLGGDRAERDVYYEGARELNDIDHMSVTRAVDRGVHLSLVRPL